MVACALWSCPLGCPQQAILIIAVPLTVVWSEPLVGEKPFFLSKPRLADRLSIERFMRPVAKFKKTHPKTYVQIPDFLSKRGDGRAR
jgi:hypothetical protein